MAVTRQQTHALITYFLQKHQEKYEREPRDFNRFRDQWGFSAMIEQYGMTKAKRIVDYYFDTRRMAHPVNYLLYNYERLNAIIVEKDADAELRKKLLEESQRRVEEWREQRGSK